MPDQAPAKPKPAQPEVPQAPLQKLLVVDDCPNIRALVRARLREENIELHFAADGMDALAQARKVLPDCILLDVDLPDVNGLEVIRRLKADSATVHVPVIFLTGEVSTEQKVKGFDLGAVDYVTKPFDPTELRCRVRATLRTKYLLDLLAQRAMIDGLTGLYNRAHFNERLAAELNIAKRSARPLSLALLDVDHFKKVNDAHGHPFGDEVLRSIGRALTARTRSCDVVCRYGGEEFALILPNTPAADGEGVAEELRTMIEGIALVHDKNPVRITASFGIADTILIEDPFIPTVSPDALVHAADQALYTSKHHGRNRVTRAEHHPAKVA